MYTVIFGGTFNPVHNAHIDMAEAVLKEPSVGNVIIMPAKIPPHKDLSPVTASAVDRFNMCKLAFEGWADVSVSDYEINKNGKNYTYDTVNDFLSCGKLGLLIGGDMLVSFNQWYKYKEIIKNVKLFVVMRKGINTEKFFAAKENLEKEGAVISVVDIQTPDISSTEVRRILDKSDKCNLVPKKVLNYITEHNLYKNSEYDIEKYKTVLKRNLSEYRYNHCLNVSKEAIRLAKKYGANVKKAEISGLLHDITKDFDEDQQLKMIDEFGIMLDDIEKNSPKLWHAITGSEYVRQILNIKDEEIVSAIRYHTTAKPNMTLLEQIIYLADFTSADRNYPDIESVRNAVDVNLESAEVITLKHTITDLVNKSVPVHNNTINAYNKLMIILQNRRTD